jgi:hypothetical protein
MRSDTINSLKKTASQRKIHVPATIKVLPAVDVLLANNEFIPTLTRNAQQTCEPQSQNRAREKFAEAVVSEPEDDRARILREQDESLVRLLSKQVQARPVSNELIFEFEKKRKM